MTASEMIERDCQRALAKINHSIATKAGILRERVRKQFARARARRYGVFFPLAQDPLDEPYLRQHLK